MNAPVILENKAMTGTEKAAVLMLSLGQEFGRPIWEQLSDEEVKDLSAAMSTLGSVKADQKWRVLARSMGRSRTPRDC
jgi:flagellar motor switch protein FliG